MGNPRHLSCPFCHLYNNVLGDSSGLRREEIEMIFCKINGMTAAIYDKIGSEIILTRGWIYQKISVKDKRQMEYSGGKISQQRNGPNICQTVREGETYGKLWFFCYQFSKSIAVSCHCSTVMNDRVIRLIYLLCLINRLNVYINVIAYI